jgi:hypothetical protein
MKHAINLEKNASIRATVYCSQEVFRFMRRTALIILLFFLPALSNLRAEKVDNRNFAIDTYYPTPNEINLAEARARRYWHKNAVRFGPEPVYLAVDPTKIFPSEIVQDLWPKLINSQTTTALFASSLTKQGYTLNIECIMIFDTRTGHFVSNRGFASVDLPPRGGIARWGDYVARFIGTGRYL